MADFNGVKAALLLDNKVLVMQREILPDDQYGGMWDFPGGGREGAETVFACAAREVREELSITIHEDNLLWQKVYPALRDPAQLAYFIVVAISKEDVVSIHFGSEGQGWRLMDVDEFLHDPDAIPQYRERLQTYLESTRK